MIWRSTLRAFVATGCALVVVVAGCSAREAHPPQSDRPSGSIEAPFAGAPELPPPDMTDDGPGSLVAVESISPSQDFDQVNAVAQRVVYRSTNARGDATTVSGVVAVPPGDPPPGGWPIISFGHDLIGLRKECAPSLADNLGGYASILSVLADRGYVVAMADYEGLGSDGVHPALDSKTLGRNIIDIVRAARHVVPAAGTRWAAFGIGQGGAATWGADADAATYGAGLDLVGAVAVSPIADVTALADLMETEKLEPAQYRLAALIVSSLALAPDSRISPQDFINEKAAALWGYLTNCAVVDPAQAVAAAAGLTPADFKPKTPEAAQQLRDELQSLALPDSMNLSAPMLVVYAALDPVFLPSWTEQAIRTACSRGDPIEIKKIADVSVLTEIVLYDSVAWLQGRFSGQQAANLCVGV
jgi:alpha-beta hydrolase superfamily lysophospholipase